MQCISRFATLARWGLVGHVCLAAAAGCGDNLGAPGAGPDAGAGTTADAALPADAAPPPDGGQTIGDPAQAGGTPTAVELVGDLAYIGVGPRLAIWRAPLRVGSEPQLVGESAPLPGVVTGLAVSGARAFVAERVDLAGRIHVIDVSDPARPVETTSFVLAEREGAATIPRGMVVLGDRLFVADQEQGIAEVDVSDPDAPSLIRIVPQAGVAELEVVGTRLYYANQSFGGSGVGALDLEDDLALLGEWPLDGANGIAIGAQDLVVTAGVGGIHVFDVSDLSQQPVERFAFVYPEEGPFSRAVAMSGTAAWIPAHDGLHVLDLSTPTAITRAGPFPLATAGANAVSRAGDTLAEVTDRGQLLFFDVAASGQPAALPAADVTLCAECLGTAVGGELLFTADFFGGLRVGRVADLSIAGRSSEPAEVVVFEDVAVAGDTAYAADWLFGLRIYDVADPSAPALVGSVDTAGYPSSVAVVGTLAYLGESTNGGNLRVIDVAEPSRAREIGAIQTSQARDVEVQGGLAFVADASLELPGGLRIFDVSDPASMSLVGYHGEGCSEALDVALTGSLAVVACSYQGFHVLDVSDPASPALLAVVPAPGIASAWSVAAWEGGAALGHDFGVIRVDLANPRAPVAVEEHTTSWAVRALIAPGDGRLVASCGPGGVYQWPLR